MTPEQMAQKRDELLAGAEKDIAAAADAAAQGRDSRHWCNVAGARKDLAFTLDTMSHRAARSGEGADDR